MVQKIENVGTKTAIASIALDFFNSPGGLGKLSAVKILTSVENIFEGENNSK